MSILFIFSVKWIPELRISGQRACWKFSKSRQKQGIDLQPSRVFKTIRSVFYFKLGIGHSVESFQTKFLVPRYLIYSCLKRQGYSCCSEAILEDFDLLRGQLNSLNFNGFSRNGFLKYLPTLNFLRKLLTELPIPSMK